MREYYFKVITDSAYVDPMLVKAKDVIEAGNKAAETLLERGYIVGANMIIEVTRTDIDQVID